MTYAELETALQDMKRTRFVINEQARTIAALFLESMQNADAYTLKKIKKQLRAFDAHRGCWTF